MEVITIASMLAKTLLMLMKPLTSHAMKECAKIWNADQELEKLIATYVRVKAVLVNCEKNKTTQINDSALEKWFHELEWFCYDIEDLVDDLSEPKSRKRITTPRKIVDLRIKLEEMCGWIQDVLAAANQSRSIQMRDEQFSVVTLLSDQTPLVSGTERDEDKQLIIRKLTSPSLPGVSIIGMDGLGKTSLARMVAADDSIKSEFSLILCAHVSGHFRTEDVVKKLFASSNQGVEDLLKGQKTLIILDDLWSVKIEDWENFEHNFLRKSRCWKVLVTTRNPNVVLVTGTNPYHLKRMSDVDCKNLIMEIAKLSEFDCKIWANDIDGIAKKCKGLPIIARKLGLTLSTKRISEDELKDAMRQFKKCINLMELPEFIQLHPRLMLNKPQLQPHLKRCLAYCSLFLPGHTFQKDDLIQFWEVEGLIQPQICSGSQCFDDLLSRSIFQPPDQPSSDKQEAYEIHYFNRQFVETLASKVFLRIEEGTKDNLSNSKNLRHLSLTCQNINISLLLEQIKECHSLRTFLLLHPNKPKTLSIPYSSFQKLERLRLLDLSYSNISKLKHFAPPKPLKHLRYLDLSKSDIKSLPSFICPLFPVLQVLKLEDCFKLERLPRDLNKLVSLKHLLINRPVLPSQPSKLGMLTNLECLSSYVVGKEEGYKIGELKNMVNLKEICISRLGNVSSGIEAQEIMLNEKWNLSNLTLEWDGLGNQTADVVASDVIGGLEPENGLKYLIVRNYHGEYFPEWLTSSSRKLVSIYLVNCIGCTSLPPFGQLPILNTLSLDSFENLEVVDREISGQGVSRFPRLESIEFRDMPKLHCWDIEEGDMPCLLHVRMIDCPKLVNLPQLDYSRLKTFKIENSPKHDVCTTN